MQTERTRGLVVKQKRNGDLKQVNKLDVFLKEFLENGGNATMAVMSAFGVKNKASASVIGSRYLKQARGTARLMLEEKGATYGKLLELAWEKAQAAKNPEWFDRVMKIAGYEDFMSKNKGNVNVNILTAQNDKNDFKGFIEEGEIVEEGEIDGDEVSED